MEPTLPWPPSHIFIGLEFVHAWLGAYPDLDFPDGKNVIGVDLLTGHVLEARVALEACA